MQCRSDNHKGTPLEFEDGKDCPACDLSQELDTRNAELQAARKETADADMHAAAAVAERLGELKAKNAKAVSVATALLQARDNLIFQLGATKRENDELRAKLQAQDEAPGKPVDELADAVAALRQR